MTIKEQISEFLWVHNQITVNKNFEQEFDNLSDKLQKRYLHIMIHFFQDLKKEGYKVTGLSYNEKFHFTINMDNDRHLNFKFSFDVNGFVNIKAIIVNSEGDELEVVNSPYFPLSLTSDCIAINLYDSFVR